MHSAGDCTRGWHCGEGLRCGGDGAVGGNGGGVMVWRCVRGDW